MSLDDVVNAGRALRHGQVSVNALQNMISTGLDPKQSEILSREYHRNPEVFYNTIEQNEEKLYNYVKQSLGDLVSNVSPDVVAEISFKHSKEYAEAVKINGYLEEPKDKNGKKIQESEKDKAKRLNKVREAYASTFSRQTPSGIFFNDLVTNPLFSEAALNEYAEHYVAITREEFRELLLSEREKDGKKTREYDFGKMESYLKSIEGDSQREAYIMLGNFYSGLKDQEEAEKKAEEEAKSSPDYTPVEQKDEGKDNVGKKPAKGKGNGKGKGKPATKKKSQKKTRKKSSKKKQ